MAGRLADIHPGERERLSPAMPIACAPLKVARCSGFGTPTKRTAGTPFAPSCSSTSVEPVKSSP